MACSKIFSGDLPELINEIIQYFRNDFSTLHSCILVNRLWCRLSIPLLWEDPFSMRFPKNYHFIKIYLNSLNEDDKTKLNEYGINNKFFPSNTLFNYPSFIKRLNTCRIGNSIEKAVRTLAAEEQTSTYSIQNTNLLNLLPSHPCFDRHLNFARLIYKLLFKIFIENEVKLHTFDVTVIINIDYDYFNDTFELILQNPTFIRNIKNLKLYFSKIITNFTNIYPFLIFLNTNCNSISSLYFQFPSENDNMLIEIYLSQIINSQKNLEKISFERNYLFKGKFLLPLKDSNCSNTLRTIIFNRINFKNVIILSEVFDYLNTLESIHIYCCSLNHNLIQQINNIIKPFKLKSLFMDEILKVESLQLLLQKSGDYLENIGFESSISNALKQQLFEPIKNYCSKIKLLKLHGFNNQNIYSALNLIKNIEQNLNYLSIDALNYYNQTNNDVELSTMVLINLGNLLPLKLEYLNFSLKIKTCDLEVFLKNSQNTFINKLLISNKMQEESDDILPIIKKYIMRKKKVKYLAIVKTFLEKSEDLFSLKDEVKEFELYDIKVQNYNEQNIDCYKFIKESY
jgi:hypothetical protein